MDTIEGKVRELGARSVVDARRPAMVARATVADRITEAPSPPALDNTDQAMLHWVPLVVPLLAAFVCSMAALIWVTALG